MIKLTTVAVLETMWGWCGMERDRTRWFMINQHNHTGKRLYSLLEHKRLLVTNACPQTVERSHQHGTPDPQWLLENLNALQEKYAFEQVLVCGSVAQQTILKTGFETAAQLVFMPHPAARMWTKEAMRETRQVLRERADRHLFFKDGQFWNKELDLSGN